MRHLLCGGLFFLALLGWSEEPATHAKRISIGKLVSAAGDTELRHGIIAIEKNEISYHDNVQSDLHANAPLYSGDILSTKAASRAKIMIGANLIADLAPSTILSIETAPGDRTIILLLQGKVRILATQKGSLTAATPLARTLLNSTGEFIVSHTPATTTEITAIEGKLSTTPMPTVGRGSQEKLPITLATGDRLTVLRDSGDWRKLATAELKRVRLSSPELEAAAHEASYLGARNPDFLPTAPTGFMAPSGQPLELSGVRSVDSEVQRSPSSLAVAPDQIIDENAEMSEAARTRWSHTNGSDPTVVPHVNLPTPAYRRLTVPSSP